MYYTDSYPCVITKSFQWQVTARSGAIISSSRPRYSNNYKITNCFPSIKYKFCHIIQEYAYNLFVSMRVPRVKHKDVILCYLNILYGRWSDDLNLDTLWLSRQKQKHEKLESQLLGAGPALCHYHYITSYKYYIRFGG